MSTAPRGRQPYAPHCGAAGVADDQGVPFADPRQTMRRTILMARRKNIALLAHDNRKEKFLKWARENLNLLRDHALYATAATGQLLRHRLGLNVTHLESGPLGGDQEIGSRISEGQIDFVILFSDPLKAQPHDSDVKALPRITVVWNIPVACNRASADFIIASPLMSTEYERVVPDYSNTEAAYLSARLPKIDDFKQSTGTAVRLTSLARWWRWRCSSPPRSPAAFGPVGHGAASDLRIEARYSARNEDVQTTPTGANQ